MIDAINGRQPAAARRPSLGILEWFNTGEEARVERVLASMRSIGCKHLRTGISWAEWHTPEGGDWYEWLLPRLASEVEVLPCFTYTPPSLGIVAKTSSPPREPKKYADFIDQIITRFGSCFNTVELWNEPNNSSEWDWTLDPQWHVFTQMIIGAAYWAKQRGKRTVLGGLSPMDPAWLQMMFKRNVMEHVDIIGIHGFPGVWETQWPGWPAQISVVQKLLEENASSARIWITETGFSTWQHDEYQQLQRFVEATRVPVDRIYWYSMEDLHANRPTVDGFHMDEREYHFGLTRHDGTPKLLYRLWSESGLEGVVQEFEQAQKEKATRQAPLQIRNEEYVLITGGAGFVGTNLAHRYLSRGDRVLIYDNLSRPGVEHNLAWLRERHGDRLLVDVADMRNSYKLTEAIEGASGIFHLAAQVAVTTSLLDPVSDFEVNARGTLNLLEALRLRKREIPLIFTSTNKVYGDLQDVVLAECASRYVPCDDFIEMYGISEEQPLDFHSPYGASKGAADQYVLDYARSFGLQTAVLRMSCIYGPHQFGTEDQGWVAHFLMRALRDQPITIYGDGKQVRDILFVDDLVEALVRVYEAMPHVAGQAYNIGGGPENSCSLLELLKLIADLKATTPEVRFATARTGDQRYFVSDSSRLQESVGWRPSVKVTDGVARLYEWLERHRTESREAPVFENLERVLA